MSIARPAPTPLARTSVESPDESDREASDVEVYIIKSYE